MAERERSSGDAEAKLAAIRKAASYEFPEPDIDTMLAEIEAGRLAGIEAAFKDDPAADFAGPAEAGEASFRRGG